jgi:ubiquinone/menaquinone biosynthesis C-methylase UbiE
MTTFKDNFSKQSDIYVKYRPHYPTELYSYLASLTKSHQLAWDCGTGNGQAAIGLAGFYDRIIATDPSEQQIKNAIAHQKVSYHVSSAENSVIDTHSIDLLTVANALHWFDFDKFYKEVKRVLKNDGVFAAWCYQLPIVEPGIDDVIKNFHNETLNDYWQSENRLVEREYRDIQFPFEEISSPAFFSEKIMNLEDFIGYLNTWSATQRYIKRNNCNPTENIRIELRNIWGKELKKKITWKLVLKVGRISH